MPRISPRTWLTIIVVGLAGQLAWVVENMYLNLFIYHEISTSPAVIAVTVAASAIAATLATLIAGAWSDRVGRRRVFVAVGYLLWGTLTAAFGLFGTSGHGVVASGFTAAAVGIIVADVLMTLAGSTANDAAFNAWVTDSTTPANRGRVDSVLATLPLIAMLLVFGLLDPITEQGHWRLFFLIIGAITSAVGVLAWFLISDVAVPTRDAPLLSAIVGELTPNAMRRNPMLYWNLGLLATCGIASQTFMPYLMIYLQNYLHLDAYVVVLGVVLILAAILSVLGGRIMDRVGKEPYFVAIVVAYALALVGMFFARGAIAVTVLGTLTMFAMMASTASTTAMTRDTTPDDRVGIVQGLRIIAAVLIPMVIGPSVGAMVVSNAGETYVDLGVSKPVPGPQIFLAAAGLLVLVPLVWWGRRSALSKLAITRPVTQEES